MYFALVQECEKGVNRWIEILTPGAAHADHSEQSEPAAALKLLPRR